MVGRPRLPWGRRKGEEGEPQPAAAAATAPPLPRPATTEHHWLTVVVARHGPAGPVPVPGARLLVRDYPGGQPVARGTADADGIFTLLLPAGRYSVAATHEGAGRAVTVTLEHAGKATIVLETYARRVTLTVDAASPRGEPLSGATIEVRTSTGNTLVARATADEVGVASMDVPAGAYEVRVGATAVRTYVEADTLLRVTAEPAFAPAPPVVDNKYAQKIRVATQYAAPFSVAHVRDDGLN